MSEAKPASGRYKWGDAEHERITDMKTVPEYKNRHILRMEIKTRDLTEGARNALGDFFKATKDVRVTDLDNPDGHICYIFSTLET